MRQHAHVFAPIRTHAGKDACAPSSEDTLNRKPLYFRRRKFKLCEERGCSFCSLLPPSGDLSEHSALRAAMMSYPDSSLFNQPVEHPSGVLREERLEDELALAHSQAQSQFACSSRQVSACQDHPASHGREERLQELIKRLAFLIVQRRRFAHQGSQ